MYETNKDEHREATEPIEKLGVATMLKQNRVIIIELSNMLDAACYLISGENADGDGTKEPANIFQEAAFQNEQLLRMKTAVILLRNRLK